MNMLTVAIIDSLSAMVLINVMITLMYVAGAVPSPNSSHPQARVSMKKLKLLVCKSAMHYRPRQLTLRSTAAFHVVQLRQLSLYQSSKVIASAEYLCVCVCVL